MANLRNSSSGNQATWTKEQLKAGFLYFKGMHGRFPTSHEIDAFPYRICHQHDRYRGHTEA